MVYVDRLISWSKSKKWKYDKSCHLFADNKMELFAFGFSLTGHDEIEIGAGTNEDRVKSLIKLKIRINPRTEERINQTFFIDFFSF